MPNIVRVLEQAVERYGDAVAYGGLSGGVTYRQMYRSSVAIASRLTELGAKRAIVAEPNSPLIPAAIFGAAMAGATYVPLNFRLPETARTRMHERLAPAVVIGPDWLEPEPDGSATASVAGTTTTDQGADPAAIVFTSGSSAEPKAVVLDHEHLMRAALREPQFGAAPGEAALLTSPPFHLPNILILLASLHAGRRLVPYTPSRFSAEHWLTVVRAEGITHAIVIPTMLQRIVHHLEISGEEAPPLARLGYGSARMPQPVLARAMKLFPDSAFSNSYGSTEATGAVTVLNADDHRAAAGTADPAVADRLRSAGKPLPGIEIRIVDAGLSAVREGETGRILVRGPQVSGRYLDAPPARVGDGWLVTGDEGWIDADGYLFCAGRGDEILVIGGENVAVVEIEDVLIKHPAIVEAAVVGVDNAEWGEIPVAMIALTGPSAATVPAGLSEWTRERLGSLKTPRSFYVVDELPQTATGKLLRREVRRHVERMGRFGIAPASG